MQTLGVIPARYASSRFMGKPLVDIGGKTMIQRVYEQASKCPSLNHLVVATDDERIFNHVQSFGGHVLMTAAEHQSGTDRCAEVVAMLNIEWVINPTSVCGKTHLNRESPFDIVINIQGDEPFIAPENIEKLVGILRGQNAYDIATLMKPIDNPSDIENPNIVKVVFTAQGQALYFSRAPIPFIRNAPPQYSGQEHYRHIGLYGFRTPTLLALAALQPSRLEQLEALEQLRWLEAGYTIGIDKTEFESIGIDTLEDLEKLKLTHEFLF
jgi:3-deoxy-manno-octulosonate cytidylyltransferase (CMP-KDO synthetase)